MLVLALKVDDSVMVGDGVEVVLLRVDGGQIRLGFKAAKEVPIHRKKIWNRIQAEKVTS